jgi:LytTr DNA-binding domain
MLSDLKKVFASSFSHIHLMIWVIGSAVAAEAGPFGTYEIGYFPKRFLYWFLVFSVSTLLAGICRQWIRQTIGEQRPVLSDLAKVAFMVVVFTPVLFVLTNLFRYGTLSGNNNFIIFIQSVAAISGAVCITRRLLPGFEEAPYFTLAKHTSIDPLPEQAEPRLMRRLPDDFEGPILRLAVRDHFVDVVTIDSTHTIRLRFLDAIDEMDSVEGYCTHRSHWVARNAVIQSERDSGRVFLRLVNQDLVPVSRKYKPELELAGIV